MCAPVETDEEAVPGPFPFVEVLQSEGVVEASSLFQWVREVAREEVGKQGAPWLEGKGKELLEGKRRKKTLSASDPLSLSL